MAVYGTLKKFMSNHEHFLEQAAYGGTVYMEFEKMSTRGFPRVTFGSTSIQSKENDQSRKILECELYLVDDNELRNIDRLEGEGSFYRRVKKTYAVFDSEKKQLNFGQAFVYEILPKNRSSQEAEYDLTPYKIEDGRTAEIREALGGGDITFYSWKQ